MALPVVASSLAAAGLDRDDVPPPPLTVADSPTAVASALLRELDACARDPSPVTAGREYVTRHYSWTSSGHALERVLANAFS
jgi:hypothetical protein